MSISIDDCKISAIVFAAECGDLRVFSKHLEKWSEELARSAPEGGETSKIIEDAAGLAKYWASLEREFGVGAMLNFAHPLVKEMVSGSPKTAKLISEKEAANAARFSGTKDSMTHRRLPESFRSFRVRYPSRFRREQSDGRSF